ncbi:MAG: acetyl-CoA carboxylase, carboxyltransferase subunit beta [Alphaproteobacteria bacterium]|nr:acetyl-CoA carboxylase, carboxyltransferase subunit beta [Alphaproteobacteria bacterium]MDA7988965.1 acetyl-CoA carboxylase, carboxyltransferase subunit beta [Alphaproteobacteria bacterium]MDA8009341.1 acetyl-CoA carboxylase, carboxyltransferase subunit beta [Alphaproteobacteria bacterium]
MNWISSWVRPRIRALVKSEKQVPDNLWEKCPDCGAMIFHKDLGSGLRVCPHCQHHMRMSAADRLAMLFDDSEYETVETPKAPPEDPLRFRDRERYTERIKRARGATELQDALLAGYGLVAGQPAVVAALDFRFLGGSMGAGVGETLLAAAEEARTRRAGLVIVTSSGGARMQEGIVSLMQMPRTVIALEQVKDAGLPVIVVLADPTTGGVTASFGMLGDIHIAEPGAMIGFAGQRVIEETIRESLPSNFQRAEYLLEHGMIDMVVARAELAATLGRVLSLLLPRDGDGAALLADAT